MLSKAQVRAFHDVGFVMVPAVFSAAEVDEMRDAFERLRRIAVRLGQTQMYEGSQFVVDATPLRIHRIVWCGAAEAVLARYGSDRRLLAMAAQVLGAERMNHIINQAHFKLPGDGVEFPWHQDSTHRRYGQGEWDDVNGTGSYVQIATAIDDVTEHNGPLQLIPGSCRLGHVEAAGEAGRLPPGLDERLAISATMTAGSALLFGPYTFHRSLPNESDRPRRVFINGFAYPGANSRVYPGEGAGRLVELT